MNELVEAAPAPARKTAAPWVRGTSGNPAGRKSEAAKLRQLIGEPVKKKLADKLEELALAGDMAAMRILADRLWPVERAQAPMVRIEGLDEAKTLTEKSFVLLNAMGSGRISPDAVAHLVSVLADVGKVVENDELRRDVEQLKQERAARLIS